MSALEDYLRRRGTSPLTQALGTDDDRFKNLLRTVNTYNVNRVGGQALSLAGADIDPSGLTAQQRPGVLSTVFKALNAPRAGLFRVMGVDPELTGRDLFRSSAGDNLLEKAAKTASAFAFDVATDPLTYVGVPGVVGRKAIVQQAASPAVSKLALSVGEEALKRAGRNSDEVVEGLFRGNALVKYSDELAQRTAAGVSAGEISPEAAEAASGLAKRRADLLAKHGPEKAEQMLRRELAEEELGRIVSESLLVGGRKRALDELTRVFGSEDVARSVFNRLPDDVRGGVLLRAPWGTTVGRVPFTGRGEAFGRFGELTNQARFNATERVGRAIFGRPMIDPTTGLLQMSGGITGGLGTSGYFGPAWQQVRAGLRNAMSKPGFDILKDNLGRTTTTTYNAFRQAHRNMSAARTAGLFKVWRSLGEARAVERDWTDKGLREDYVRGLWIGYHTPDEVGFGAENLAEQAGIDQARRLRAEMNAWRQSQVDVGIPIGDLGPDAQPLILTPQEQQRLADLTPGGAGAVEGELSYTPQLPRSAYIVSRAEAEANGWSGFLIPDTDNIALNAVSINKKAGRKVAVEDPLQIAEIYMERAAKSVAQKKFVDEALRTGVLVADIDYTQTQARFDRLATFTSGLRKAVPQIADRIEAARASAAKELADQASEAMRDKTIAEATALRIKVNAEYDAAVQGQAAVRARLREATRAARQARPSRGEINARLSGYARSSAELEMQRAEAAYENALERLRAARATTRMEEVPSRSGFTEEEYAAPSSAARDAAQKELDEARAAREGMSASELAELDNYEAALVRRAEELPARSSITEEEYAALEDRYDDLILSGEAKRAAEKELAEVRAVRNRVRNAVSASELAELNNYEAALMRREKVRAEYEAARKVRNKAAERWARFKDLPAVASSAEIQRLAIRYSRAYNAVIRAQRGGADKDTIKSLRDQAKVAAKELRGAIGYKLPKGSPLALYRDTLEKLAKNLGEEEFSAATVMASEAKLTQLLDGMVDAQAANDMAAITSTAEAIKETYLSIRGKISVDDLTGLNALEQRALRAETAGDLPLLREVAKKTKYGEWLTAEDIKQITSNVTTRPPTSLVGLHATSGVRIVLENAYRAETTKAFQKFVSSVVDPLLLMWKTGVTVGRGPGYVMTNLIGGIYMSFLGGVSAQSLTESAVLLNAFRSAYAEARAQLPRASAPEQLERGAKILEKRLAGKMIGKRPAAVVLREFLEFGGYGSTQTVEALQQFRQRGIDVGDRALSYGETVRLTGEPMPSAAGRGYQKVVDLALTNPYQRVMNDWAQNSELFLRFGTYIDTLKKFDDPMMALDRVNLLHFDYSDLSDAEQSIRRLVPFYTWMRHNVPLQLRAMVLEPGKIKKWMYAQENIKAQLEDDEDSWYEQLLPEYLQDVGGFVSRISTDEGPLAFGSRMPYDDINRLFKVGGFPVNARELAKSIGPATTLPLSLATGTNLDTGAEFAPEGIEASGYQALLARVPGLGRTGAEGEARVRSDVAYALTEAVPQLSFIDRVLSTTPATRSLATQPQQQRATSNLLNLLGIPAAAGFSVTTLTPESLTGEARRRVEKQNTILEEAAGKMNVSLEWLRAQIRAGYTSEEIAAMIRRGEGNREIYEREKSKRSKGLDPRYERMLREMGRGRIELGY